MKNIRIVFAVICACLCVSATCNAQSFQWLTRMGGPDSDPNFGPDEMVTEIQVDADGNVYACGNIRSIADFNGTPVTTFGQYDIFLAKYNCHGNLVWVKTAGSGFDDKAKSLKLDNLGHIYLTGNIQASTFKPCTFFDTTVVATTNGMFLAKFDTSGNRIWSKFAGGGSNMFLSYSYKLAIDITGNPSVFLASTTTGAIFPGFNVVNGFYITSFDTTGNMTKLKAICNVDFLGEFDDFKINNANEYLISGDLSADVGGDSMVVQNQTLYNTNHRYLGFICKFDSSADLQWIYHFTDTTTSNIGGSTFRGLCTDVNNNIYASGFTTFGLKFGNYTFTDLFSPVSVSTFVVKIDSSGIPVWATQSQVSSSADGVGGVAIKNNGNIITSGYYQGPIVFGSDTLTNLSPGTQDIYIAEISASGQNLGAVSLLGSGSNEEPFCIAIDNDQNIYTAGCFDNSLYFNGFYVSSAGGYTDGFITKYGTPCITGLEENNLLTGGNLQVYPNPAMNRLNLKFNSDVRTKTVQILDIQGKIVYQENTINQNEMVIDISKLSSGLYLLKSSDETGSNTIKFIKN